MNVFFNMIFIFFYFKGFLNNWLIKLWFSPDNNFDFKYFWDNFQDKIIDFFISDITLNSFVLDVFAEMNVVNRPPLINQDV